MAPSHWPRLQCLPSTSTTVKLPPLSLQQSSNILRGCWQHPLSPCLQCSILSSPVEISYSSPSIGWTPLEMPPKRQAADAAASEATTKQPKLSTSAEDSSKPHRCPEKGCEKSYQRNSALQNHIRSFHQGRKFSCPHQDCSKEYTENGALQHHIKSSHQGKRHSCPCK